MYIVRFKKWFILQVIKIPNHNYNFSIALVLIVVFAFFTTHITLTMNWSAAIAIYSSYSAATWISHDPTQTQTIGRSKWVIHWGCLHDQVATTQNGIWLSEYINLYTSSSSIYEAPINHNKIKWCENARIAAFDKFKDVGRRKLLILQMRKQEALCLHLLVHPLPVLCTDLSTKGSDNWATTARSHLTAIF